MRLAFFIAGAALAAGGACGTPPTSGTAGARADGERLYRRHCFACHALEPGRNTPAGPTLHAVVGRAVAAEAGFNYSPALRRLAGREPRWSAELLDRFLTDPQAVAPGTEMGLAGIEAAGERRVLIAWLRER